MSRVLILRALLAVAVSLSLISNAEARRWRLWHFHVFFGHGYSVHSSDQDRPARIDTALEMAGARSQGGAAFGAAIHQVLRGCLEQATDFRRWPFDEITRIVAPDDVQRSALEALRASAAAGAERLSADCPQDDPAPPWARAEAVERAIDTATSALVAVESPMQEFYAILDDEQKARLLRDMMLSHSQAREGDRTAERSERRSRRRGDSDVGGEAKLWAGICERLNAALRGWPTREIERGVRLSEPQRVAFYKLVNSSLPVADALATGCPAETALTPPGRITQTRARLAAVRQAITAIWPAFTEFYEALDHGQKVRFAGMR